MAGKLHAGARAGTPLQCHRGPGSLQGAPTQPTPRDRPRQGTSLDLFPFSRARGGALRPERLALPGGACGTRAGRGAAVLTWRSPAPAGAGRPLAGCPRMAHAAACARARPRRPLAAPQSRVRAAPSVRRGRRGHFVGGPGAGRGAQGGGGTGFPSRGGPELRERRAETVNEPRGAAPPTQRRPGSSGDPVVTAPSPDPTPQ